MSDYVYVDNSNLYIEGRRDGDGVGDLSIDRGDAWGAIVGGPERASRRRVSVHRTGLARGRRGVTPADADNCNR